jgi:hypothetical protein
MAAATSAEWRQNTEVKRMTKLQQNEIETYRIEPSVVPEKGFKDGLDPWHMANWWDPEMLKSGEPCWVVLRKEDGIETVCHATATEREALQAAKCFEMQLRASNRAKQLFTQVLDTLCAEFPGLAVEQFYGYGLKWDSLIHERDGGEEESLKKSGLA